MGAFIAAMLGGINSGALYRAMNQDDDEYEYSSDLSTSSSLSIQQLSNRIIATDVLMIVLMLSGLCAFGYLMYDVIKTEQFVDIIVVCIVAMIALVAVIAGIGKHLYYEIKDRKNKDK